MREHAFALALRTRLVVCGPGAPCLRRAQRFFCPADPPPTQPTPLVLCRWLNCHVCWFISSLKACGTGITLTAGNKLVLLDPWWNPAAEEQAIDRIYRIGQTRPIEVTRCVIDGSIEAKMLEIAAVRGPLSGRFVQPALQCKSLNVKNSPRAALTNHAPIRTPARVTIRMQMKRDIYGAVLEKKTKEQLKAVRFEVRTWRGLVPSLSERRST